MTLANVKKHVIVNAGHHNTDPGSSAHGYIERDEVKKIRDELLPLLTEAGFVVSKIPDNLTLATSIARVNEIIAKRDDALAVDIHLDYASNPARRGATGFYGTTDTSLQIAAALSAGVEVALGVPGNGAKPDTETAVGSLGWIRQTKCWATLIEVCFISSADDMALLTAPGGYRRAAVGIANGIFHAFGVDTLDPGIESLKGEIDASIAGFERELDGLKTIRKSLT